MYQNIVVAIDGSKASRSALSEAISMAKLSRARLIATYVIDESSACTFASAYAPHVLLNAERQIGHALLNEALIQIRDSNVAGETKLLETEGIPEDIASRIARYVDGHDVDLVVMGTHGRRGMRRMMLGSVAERFVRHSHCPVLLVREPADEV